MNISTPERRQIENEMIFRRANEKVSNELDILDSALIEDGHTGLTRTDDFLLHLQCECSDENCAERIPIRLSVYQTIHENRQAFIIKPEHQVEAIEAVTETTPYYSVVEKNHSTPEPSNTLNETTVDNS